MHWNAIRTCKQLEHRLLSLLTRIKTGRGTWIGCSGKTPAPTNANLPLAANRKDWLRSSNLPMYDTQRQLLKRIAARMRNEACDSAFFHLQNLETS